MIEKYEKERARHHEYRHNDLNKQKKTIPHVGRPVLPIPTLNIIKYIYD